HLVFESHDGRAPGADSEEKHEPASDIDTVAVDIWGLATWTASVENDPNRTLAVKICCDAQRAAHFTTWQRAILTGDNPRGGTRSSRCSAARRRRGRWRWTPNSRHRWLDSSPAARPMPRRILRPRSAKASTKPVLSRARM